MPSKVAARFSLIYRIPSAKSTTYDFGRHTQYHAGAQELNTNSGHCFDFSILPYRMKSLIGHADLTPAQESQYTSLNLAMVEQPPPHD